MKIEKINLYTIPYNQQYASFGNKTHGIYKKVNKEYNKEAISDITLTRAKSLPNLMNVMVAEPIQYMNGNINSKTFTNNYLEMSVPFYKRITVGENYKEYCKSYAPEISLIKKIVKACDNYKNKLSNIKEFNSKIEDAMENYSNSDIKRTKLFIA